VRTQDELVKYIEENKGGLFSFHADVLLEYMDFEHARPYLKPEVTPEKWTEHGYPKKQDAPSITADMEEYYGFALGKAKDHRGLSANRSIQKLDAWVWLLNDDNYDKIHWNWYAQYGAPILKDIGDIYGFNYLSDENDEQYGDWNKESNEKFLRMADGKPCTDDCTEGCER
jgi:hypothetical protein